MIALDLGTTAFKAAPVDAAGRVGEVAVVPCRLNHADGGVTCAPELYVRWAMRALDSAVRSAAAAGLEPKAIGISSQAQTFVGLDATDRPLGDAIVWTDDRAGEEAADIGRLCPDFAAASGFVRPSPLQFLPKLVWMRRRRPDWTPARVVLLNEWVILNLTGRAFGDETLQGMGGLFDIREMRWRPTALAAAGLVEGQLAEVGPAGAISGRLTEGAARRLGGSLALPSGEQGLQVYSCGNDQSCAAIGAGITRPGDVLCNFGTAMIVYTVHDAPVAPATDTEIAGLHPRDGRSFLLGCESEFGNVLEWMARLLYPRRGVGALLSEGTREGASEGLPVLRPEGGGRLALSGLSLGHRRGDIARGVVESYTERFAGMLASVTRGAPITRLAAAGGASRSADWLAHLGRRVGMPLQPVAWEHAGLAGIAKIVTEHEGWDT